VEEETSNLSIFKTGAFLGINLILTITTIHLYYTEFTQLERPMHADYSFSLFQIMFYPVFLLQVLAINVNVWTYFRINYVFILELNPKSYMSNWAFTDLTSMAYFIWIFHLFIYIECVILNLEFHFISLEHIWIIPIIMYIIILGWLFLPFNIFYKPARYFFQFF
jgi:hypothetical protein